MNCLPPAVPRSPTILHRTAASAIVCLAAAACAIGPDVDLGRGLPATNLKSDTDAFWWGGAFEGGTELVGGGVQFGLYLSDDDLLEQTSAVERVNSEKQRTQRRTALERIQALVAEALALRRLNPVANTLDDSEVIYERRNLVTTKRRLDLPGT